MVPVRTSRDWAWAFIAPVVHPASCSRTGASDAQALHDQAAADGVRILVEPFDGPFGRTFAMADPDGYRVTIYERDQPLFWPPRPR
jgi:predicted enzyme related to lactoylglutathione lyase